MTFFLIVSQFLFTIDNDNEIICRRKSVFIIVYLYSNSLVKVKPLMDFFQDHLFLLSYRISFSFYDPLLRTPPTRQSRGTPDPPLPPFTVPSLQEEGPSHWSFSEVRSLTDCILCVVFNRVLDKLRTGKLTK